MRVLHLTISLEGGAGIACRRLHESLLKLGLRSEIWATHGEPAEKCSIIQPRWWRWRARLDRWPLRQYSSRNIFSWWSNNCLPGHLLRKAATTGADLLHLHWVGDGWIDPAELTGMEIPIVWTLHDAWPFTGGCHYPATCERFAHACGSCPQLGSNDPADLSARNHGRKLRALAPASVTVVTPSRWLGALAARSAILGARRIEVVPNGLAPDRFFPGDRKSARESLHLSEHEIALLVFVGGDSSDFRKGVDLLQPALALLPDNLPPLRLFVIGGGTVGRVSPGIEVVHLGRVCAENRLASIYTAMDAHILPSRQDNLPNTALEALACGCPVLAFSEGGLPELVRSEFNGLLASSASAAALASIVARFATLGNDQRSAMRQNSRQHFLENFTAHEKASEYVEIYRSVLHVRESLAAKYP